MKRTHASSFFCKLAFLLSIFPFSVSTVSAEYLMTAPPRETPEQGQELYAKFAAEIGRVLNEKVTYEHPGNWAVYKKKVKSGKYDFIFDEPHFAAWRLRNLEVEPLVKLPGTLTFVLVTGAGNDVIKTKENFVARKYLAAGKICTLPSPSLGTLSAYAMYPHALRQPKFVTVRGGFSDLMEKFNAGKCDAAILSETFFKNTLDEATRNSLKVVEKSKALTNQGITISKRVDEEKQRRLIDFLTGNEGRNAIKPIIDRFSSPGEMFVAAKESDYEGHNLLVENMIFGW